MEEWKKRLTQAREAAGLRKGELAKLIPVSNPTITDWEKSIDSGGIVEITGPKMTRLCEVLGITPRWLLYGEVERTTADLLPGAMPVHVTGPDDDGHVQIPMVTLRLQAGVTGFQTEPDRRDGGTFGVRKRVITQKNLNPAKLVAIPVQGESMEPALYDGDVVVIDTADKRPVDGVVFAVNYEGEAIVKRLSRDAGDWWLTSDNMDQRKYHRKICRGEACIIVGRVVLRETLRV